MGLGDLEEDDQFDLKEADACKQKAKSELKTASTTQTSTELDHFMVLLYQSPKSKLTSIFQLLFMFSPLL